MANSFLFFFFKFIWYTSPKRIILDSCCFFYIFLFKKRQKSIFFKKNRKKNHSEKGFFFVIKIQKYEFIYELLKYKTKRIFFSRGGDEGIKMMNSQQNLKTIHFPFFLLIINWQNDWIIYDWGYVVEICYNEITNSLTHAWFHLLKSAIPLKIY